MTAWVSHCQHSDQTGKRTNIINHQAICITKNIFLYKYIYKLSSEWMHSVVYLGSNTLYTINFTVSLFHSVQYGTKFYLKTPENIWMYRVGKLSTKRTKITTITISRDSSCEIKKTNDKAKAFIAESSLFSGGHWQQ